MRHSSQALLRRVLSLLLVAALFYAPLLALRTKPTTVAAAGRALHPLNFPAPQYLTTFTARLRRLAVLWQSGSNLDTLRNTLPAAPNAYTATGTLPPAGYDDPKPTNAVAPQLSDPTRRAP